MITDESKLSDLVRVWYHAHGHTLKDAKYRYKRTIAIVNMLGDPHFCDFSAREFAIFRQKRITEVSTATVNHETRYLRAVFNELIRLEFIDRNPIENVRTFAVSETELAYLTDHQIDDLFLELSKSRNREVYWVAYLSLSTGCRWGEAEKIRPIDLLNKNFKQVRFVDTKNGKTRIVAVSDFLFNKLHKLSHNKTKHKPIFTSSRSAFRSALRRAGLGGFYQQQTHILRHSFASHYLMNGGHIESLQRILGHSDIKTTMRYVHFSDSYLADAVLLNPANRLESLKF